MYIVGNWKMNQTKESISTFFKELDDVAPDNVHRWISPQSIHIPLLLEQAQKFNLKIGAQNICDQESGAFTGELSPLALKDIGGSFTLIGHSERRAIYKEDNELLYKKVQNALNHDLVVIFCCGETWEEREAGKTNEVVSAQLKEGLKGINDSRILIAYEPVWAIGTGKTATAEDANNVHRFIKEIFPKTPLLYGGSVKPANAKELLGQDSIDGVLVGGASLKGSDFSGLYS